MAKPKPRGKLKKGDGKQLLKQLTQMLLKNFCASIFFAAGN